MLQAVWPFTLFTCMAWSIWFSPTSLASQQVLTLGLPSEGYAPYIIINNQQVSGILIEPLQLAASQLDLTLVYQFYPEKRSSLMLEHNLIDARMESEQWVSNPQDYLWSEAITELEDVLIFNKNAGEVFDSEGDLADTTLIGHLGYSYPTLQPLIERGWLKRIDLSSEFDMLNYLYRPLAGIKSVTVMNKFVAISIVNNTHKFHGHFAISTQPIAKAPLQFQFFNNPRLAAIVSQLNPELQKLKRNGTVEQIITKILNTENTQLK